MYSVLLDLWVLSIGQRYKRPENKISEAGRAPFLRSWCLVSRFLYKELISITGPLPSNEPSWIPTFHLRTEAGLALERFVSEYRTKDKIHEVNITKLKEHFQNIRSQFSIRCRQVTEEKLSASSNEMELVFLAIFWCCCYRYSVTKDPLKQPALQTFHTHAPTVLRF